MLTQIELNAIADFAINNFDYDAKYEDDQFAVTIEGVRCYCERYNTHFRIEVGHEDNVVELPRH
ncbi:hypothetical protein [Sphingomonas sp. BAUL-RG-20F-R05-02]|uniref:hypothetical protein n=1 Tax=Sphingomonas sp. BAUL-RG-20F-R05-02 TaxID=2914830 RepID=UPI001F59EB6D|nr:hypothetical protein [Sphingomonas sp. BAUL-RG-20F-R05-02]